MNLMVKCLSFFRVFVLFAVLNTKYYSFCANNLFFFYFGGNGDVTVHII